MNTTTLSEFTDLIEVTIGKGDETITVAGTFFGVQPRLVKILKRHVEASTKGHLLILENTDEPGIVGAVGQILGENGVNIASMSLSRNKIGGKALNVINVDSKVSDEALAKIEAINGVQQARAVEL